MTGGRRSWPLHGDEIVAVARYDGRPGSADAEIAVTVEDAWQHQGIGHASPAGSRPGALDHGFERFIGTMLPDNREAIGLLHRLSSGRERSVQRRHLRGGGAAVARELTPFSARVCRPRPAPTGGRSRSR